MRFKYYAAVLSTFLLVACGPSEQSPVSTGSTAAALASLPATLDGNLALFGGGEDPDGSGAYSAFHLGTLTVGSDEISIKVSQSIADAAGVTPPEGGKVRVTLGSKVDFLGEPVYTVTALQKL